MEIPVISLTAPDAGAKFVDACETVGFASIVDHGVPTELIASMRARCAELFALPEKRKTELSIRRDDYRGFIPLGFFTPNRDDSGVGPDHYEGFKLHWECPPDHPVRAECDLYGSNRWPAELPALRHDVLDYWNGCSAAASSLLSMLAPALGVDERELHGWHDAPLTNMTLLHYPAQPAAADPAGIHPHKDTNVLTLLHPDPVGGLEIRSRDGSWIEADPPEEALLVNTGEMLELWSGGRFPATPHRVVNRTGGSRISFPWFLVPNHAVTVEPIADPVPGFERAPMPVGALSAEVWRTNWPDTAPSDAGHDLGTLDRDGS